MGARIRTLVDFKLKVKALKEDLTRALGVSIADASAEIVIRTTRGEDVDGKTFKEYSPGYKKYRKNKLKRQVEKVNLQVTGQMLASIRQTIKQEGDKLVGTIDFGDETSRTKAEGNSRYRKFFGLSTEQVQKITETLKQETKRR